MADNEVKVDQEKPWYQKGWEKSPLARLISVQSGEVPAALQGTQEKQYGLPGLLRGVQTGLTQGAFNVGDALSRWATGGNPNAPLLGDLMYDPAVAQSKLGSTLNPADIITNVNQIPAEQRIYSTSGKDYPSEAARLADEQIQAQIAANRAAEATPAGPSASDFLAQYGGQFDATPYTEAEQYMMDRRKAQLEAIQSMYNDYANEAAANAQRVADIYAGAEQGIGGTYEGAKAQTEAAYGSAQQQAADQLARLGIEAAAPAVANPMALSQAEAVSNLIANQAAGEGAIQRFGATGGDFASSMAQIAQQQSVENQAAASQQLADQLFQLDQERRQAEAAYNPYEQAMQRLQFEQAFNAPALEQQAAQAEAIQRAAELQLDTTLARQDKLVQLWSEIRKDYASDEEAWAAAQTAISQAEAQYPIF